MQTTHPSTLTLKDIQSWFGRRPADAHKYLFGHVLVVGGDVGMPGSVRIAAEGALRTGAGLVSVITHAAHALSITAGRPELLCYGFENINSALDDIVKKSTVIVLGPGLGKSAWSKQLFNYMMQQSQPKIIDADALNWLSKSNLTLSENSILTPHPGEAGKLLNTSASVIQQDRLKAIALLTQKYPGITILKGANSIIGSSTNSALVCPYGNPGMATAGMGDLLSGVIAGCVAQDLSLWQSACAGVYLHAWAGDMVAASQGQRGLLASDLLQELPRLINDLGQTN